MNTILDILLLRRPKLDYIAPPVCEVVFSSTGFPVIVLSSFTKRHISGLVSGGTGPNIFTLTWNNTPGALCYTIYKADDPNQPNGTYTVVEECVNNPCGTGMQCLPVEPGCYEIAAVTLDEGETDLSDPICVECTPVEIVDTPAEGLTDTTANLHGFVNPKNLPTTAYFEWGTTMSLGNVTPAQDAGNGNELIEINETLTGLTPSTHYFFRFTTENSCGVNSGAIQAFDTAAPGPPPPLEWEYSQDFAGPFACSGGEVDSDYFTIDFDSPLHAAMTMTPCSTGEIPSGFECPLIGVSAHARKTFGPFGVPKIITINATWTLNASLACDPGFPTPGFAEINVLSSQDPVTPVIQDRAQSFGGHVGHSGSGSHSWNVNAGDTLEVHLYFPSSESPEAFNADWTITIV